MAKNQQNFSSVQSELFQQLEQPNCEIEFDECADLDYQAELRGALATALKLARRRGMSRELVVDEMNRLLPELPANKRITKRKLDSWLATSKEDHEFPARFIGAFCAATKCDLPLRIMAHSIRMDLSDPRELMAQEYGEIEIKRALLARQARVLKSRLGD